MADNENNNTNKSATNREVTDPTRRKFLKNSGIAIGGVAGGTILGSFLPLQSKTKDEPKTDELKATPTEARMFFERYEDFVVLEQATERILPKDENGPGAIELGVPYYIDKQMAGSWGMNGTDYRHGPFISDEPTVDQSSLTRGQILISGLRKMNEESMKRFETTFNEAEEEQQIEILTDFESSKVKMYGANAGSFFGLLRELTIEGAYSDPLYGGNRNMAGWKMQEFPGAVSSYADIIEGEEFVVKDPISLTDYQQKS